VSGQIYLIACDRIAAPPGFALDHFQGAEPDYVYALAFDQLVFDQIKQQIDKV
jgi:hypothetical protein